MGWCSLRTSEWDILSFMRYSCPAFTYASFTHVVSGKLPAQPWYLCSCSRWVLLPCAAGGTQTVNTLLPNWRIAGLNDSPAVTLSLLCLLCHTTRYLLGSLSVSVMGFDSVWVQCFFSPPVMSLKSSVWLPTVQVAQHHAMWMLTSAALCGDALRLHSVASNWFIVMAGKWKVD